MKTNKTTENIWQKIQSGDKVAFSDLFKQYYESLYRFAFRFVNDAQLAENIVQEVFVKIWINRAKYQIESNIKSFLFTAVRNQCLNELRQQKRNIPLPKSKIHNEQSVDSVEYDYIITERNSEIYKAINNLPEKCRQIYLMKNYDGLKYKEIAEVLNISVNTVKTQLKRAIKSLLKQLSNILNTLIS